MLGEMLVKVGALTRAQLEQVLNAQAIYGGRLGTNLVEMGYIAEEELTRVLKEKAGVPCVDAATLNSLPEEVLSVVPLELVRRYHVLPVALSGKRLTLAMVDPTDFKAIEEIGFVTGLIIVPRVCTELRLNMALERLFGIKRQVRYIPVAGGFRSRFSGDDVDGRPEADGVPEAADGNAESVAAGAKGADVVASGGPREAFSVNDLAERLGTASSEAEVVSVLLAYLEAEFDGGGFLTVKGGMVTGVQAVCTGRAVEGFSRLAIPIEQSRLLAQVVKEKRLYIGELGAEGAEGMLLRALGGEAKSPVLLVPVAVHGYVAALICANDLKGRLAGGLFDLQRVAAMAELTFEMVCLRKRIKSC